MKKLIFYTFMKRIRDKGDILLSIIQPIILILILGSVFQGSFEAQDLKGIHVAYYGEDNSIGQEAFEEFLNDDRVGEWLNIYEVSSYEEGKEYVENNRVSGFIYIPSDFTYNIINNSDARISIYDNGLSIIRPQIINNIVSLFTSGGNLMLTELNMTDKTIFDFNEEDIKLIEGETSAKNEFIKSIPLGNSNNIDMSGMDYYSVTMLVMFIMWGIFQGVNSIREDLFTPNRYRILSAPINKYKYYISKNIGVLLTFFVQILSIIFFTKYFYNVNWGDNLLIIILISLLISIVAINIGICISMIFKSENKVAGAVNGFVVISTFIAGGFTPIESDNIVFILLRNLSPNYHGQRAIFNIVYNGSSNEVLISILSLIAISIVLLITSLYFGRRNLIEDI